MKREYTAYRDFGWFNEEQELLCKGDYQEGEPTITSPIERCQEGTASFMDGFTVYQVRPNHHHVKRMNITEELTSIQIDELEEEMIADYEENLH